MLQEDGSRNLNGPLHKQQLLRTVLSTQSSASRRRREKFSLPNSIFTSRKKRLAADYINIGWVVRTWPEEKRKTSRRTSKSSRDGNKTLHLFVINLTQKLVCHAHRRFCGMCGCVNETTQCYQPELLWNFFNILRWSSGGGLSDKPYRLKTRMETPKVIPDFATGARQLLAPRARSMERAERGLLAAVAQCIAEFPDNKHKRGRFFSCYSRSLSTQSCA